MKMENKDQKSKAPINISASDVERAFKKVEEFKKLLKKGKTPQEIFKDLTRMIEVDK
jgi:hypothetical protein